MIIAVNDYTNTAVEAYPYYKNIDVSVFVEDLENHAIMCLRQEEIEFLTLFVYGKRRVLNPGEALIIGHPYGVNSYSIDIISINKLQADYTAYNGNQLLRVINSEGQEALMINPMAVQPQQLLKELSPYFDSGLKVYGTILNDKVKSIDKLTWDNQSIRLTESGFMYFMLYKDRGKLIVSIATNYTFFTDWKLSHGNEWLSSSYGAMCFGTIFEQKKTKVICSIDYSLEAIEVALLMERLGFKVITTEERFYKKDNMNHVLSYVELGGTRIIISDIKEYSMIQPVFQVYGQEVINSDLKVGPVLNRLLCSKELDTAVGLSDKKEVKDFFDKLLVKGYKKNYNSATVLNTPFKKEHYYTFSGDVCNRKELRSFVEKEEREEEYFGCFNKNSVINRIVMNNVRIFEKDVIL